MPGAPMRNMSNEMTNQSEGGTAAPNAPFFIVGASRSGTTMLRLLLNAHSRLGVPKELAYFTLAMRAGVLEKWQDRAMSEAQYTAFVNGYFEKKHHIFEGVDLDALKTDILSSRPTSLRTPIQRMMEAWTAREGKQRWGEKTPKNVFYTDIIHAVFPDARFIHIVRDPRAVVYSMNRFARFLDDSIVNAYNWYLSVQEGQQRLRDGVPDAHQITIRYEDLVSDIEKSAATLCGFLGEAYEPSMLEFYRASHDHIHPASSELGGVNTLTRPVSLDSLDKWKTGLQPEDIAVVEAVCGDIMTPLGYELTGERLGPLSQLSLRAKLAYCQGQRRRNRSRRSFQIAFLPFQRVRASLATTLRRA